MNDRHQHIDTCARMERGACVDRAAPVCAQTANFDPCVPWAFLVLLSFLAAVPFRAASAQIFRSDDPIWTDPDRLDMPAPQPHEIGDYYDFWVNTFASPATHVGPALNANTVEDVPASSWYQLRHYWNPMPADALRRGPNSTGGPSMESPWRVVAAKSEGKTPGLEIVDARGDRYVMKFDPPGHIELSSGAEVISTKLLYALGYHVPENEAVRFRREQLEPARDASVSTPDGEMPLTQERIDTLLADAAWYADGSIRALASLYVEGEPIGPFSYHGTRPDDGNDIFPHEARRELRGLRVVSAWINHTDARSINSLDVVVDEQGKQFVRHYLIDFGSTLGSSAVGPKRLWDGYEYVLDPSAILLRTLTLGGAGLAWASIAYPEIPSVGHFEARHFDPKAWRPQYPNAAFTQADAADAFWAAKQIANVDDDALRAIVESAAYSDRAAAERIVEVLAERRDRIANAYLPHGGGLDRFEVRYGLLFFDDLLAKHDIAPVNRLRHTIWRPFDNQSGEFGAIIVAAPFTAPRLTIPQTESDYLSAEIRTPGGGITLVYLRRAEGGWAVIGVERR